MKAVLNAARWRLLQLQLQSLRLHFHDDIKRTRAVAAQN